MNDPLLMRCFKRLGDLFRDRQHLVHWNGATRKAVRKVFTLDQLHHKRTDPVGLFEAVDVRDVRVIQ